MDISLNSSSLHFFIEAIYVGSKNWVIIFHLNLFSRLAGPKTKIFLKKWFSYFFHIYFEARIMTTGLNIALTMLYQYLKRNPSIQIYFSTYWQKQHFQVPITVFTFFSHNLLLISIWKLELRVEHVQGALNYIKRNIIQKLTLFF